MLSIDKSSLNHDGRVVQGGTAAVETCVCADAADRFGHEGYLLSGHPEMWVDQIYKRRSGDRAVRARSSQRCGHAVVAAELPGPQHSLTAPLVRALFLFAVPLSDTVPLFRALKVPLAGLVHIRLMNNEYIL